MGYVASSSAVIVAFSRNSDGSCTTNTVGDTSGLTDDLVINGGSAADTMVNVYNAYVSLCGLSFTQANFNGHTVTVYGKGGADKIWIGGAGNDSAYGGGGNDWIRTLNPDGTISGEDGNDTLMSDSMSGSNDRTYGGNGDDCLEDQSQSASTFDCGAGNDKAFYSYPAYRQNCENTSSSCN